ncbi:MAG: alpha/beta fold hydrolase [Armatimonadetes bacterium]|nr:alpha/beta fold hydrolase [Armatimonadota bacterium]
MSAVWTVVGVLLSLPFLYLLLLLGLSYLSVRPPRVPLYMFPSQFGEPQEWVEFDSQDGLRIRGWWSASDGDVVAVFVHGYAANRCELVPYGLRLRQMGVSALYVDLRCHGASDRAKCTFGIDEAMDVRAAVAFARSKNPKAKIVVFGSSMGAAASARAWADDPGLADAMIFDGPYARLDEAARGFWHVTGVAQIARFLGPIAVVGRVWAGIDPKKVDMEPVFARLCGRPVLFLYGTRDWVVPMESASRCVSAAEAQTQVVYFEGQGHGQARYHEPAKYFDSIVAFLEGQGLVDPVQEA